MVRTANPDQLLLERLGAVCQWLEGASARDVKSVHHARVATRRLREALPVVSSGKTRRRVGRAAQRITRALGAARELDVALLTLDQIDTGGEVPRAAIVRLRALLAQDRRALDAELTRRLQRSDLPKLRARVARRITAREPDPRRDRALVATAETRAARRSLKLRAAMERAGGLYLPDRLHAVRIALKKFRYAMEIISELTGSRTRSRASSRSPRGAAARLRTLSELQDVLGRMHDLEVLIAKTRALQASAAVTSLRLSADLDRLVRRLENECRELHALYVRRRGDVLAICDHAELAAVKRARQQTAA